MPTSRPSEPEPLEKALRCFYTARLDEAAVACREALSALPERPAQLRAVLAAVLVEQGAWEGAESEIRAGMVLLGRQDPGEPAADWLALYGVLARLRRLAGDWEEALEISEWIAADYDPALGQGLRALTLSQRGDTAWMEEEAARSLDAPPPAVEEDTGQIPWVQPLHLWGTVWARVSAAQARRFSASGDRRAAAARVQPVLVYLMQRMSQAERGGLTHRIIELSILQALAMDSIGDRLRATVAVERAVRLAHAGRYTGVFLEEGEPLLYLLEALRAEAARSSGRRRSAPSSGSSTTDLLRYLSNLIDSFPGQKKKPRGQVVTQAEEQNSYAEALPLRQGTQEAGLTRRELEVLNLLMQGRSYQEIADRLVLSLPTVRWHVRGVYRKLGVSSRERAIARAREMNIVALVGD